MEKAMTENMSVNDQNYTIHPVGYVRSKVTDPSLVADQQDLHLSSDDTKLKRQAVEIKGLVAQIILNPDLDGIMDGLEDFSHAVILYWPHLVQESSRKITKVHPMGRKDLGKVGVFSSCSPARPNPILVTVVEIVAIQENILSVRGLEAVDGSPIIDIKPYNRHYLQVENVQMAGWMEAIEEELA